MEFVWFVVESFKRELIRKMRDVVLILLTLAPWLRAELSFFFNLFDKKLLPVDAFSFKLAATLHRVDRHFVCRSVFLLWAVVSGNVDHHRNRISSFTLSLHPVNRIITTGEAEN